MKLLRFKMKKKKKKRNFKYQHIPSAYLQISKAVTVTKGAWGKLFYNTFPLWKNLILSSVDIGHVHVLTALMFELS